MSYLLLIVEPIGQRAERTPEEGRAAYDTMVRFGESLRARGLLVAAQSLASTDEAVRVANDSDYGLGAAVFTRNRRTAERIARQLEAGNVAINDFVRSDPALPFGGIKQSGFGRELAEWGARSFVNVKTIIG